MRLLPWISIVAGLALASGCGSTPTNAPIANQSARPAAAEGGLILADELSGTIPAADLAPEGPRAPVDAAACLAWNELTRDLAKSAALPPPLYARAYALESVAVHDALTLGLRGRAGAAPDVLVAAAASEVLNDLFPAGRAQVEERLQGALGAARANGAARGAIERSLALGRVAGQAAVRHGQRDGSDRVWTGTIPTGDCKWTGANPLLPMAGTWRTWVTTSGAEFQPEPPYACGSPQDLADVDEVVQIAAQRTTGQIAIVHKWADRSPPAIWNDLAAEHIRDARLGAVEAARLQAWMNMAIFDGFVSCWRSKYEYWMARPVMRSPGLTTVVPTPNFPSYTSGHSTVSAAAATVLGEAFPADAGEFLAEAQEAAISRLWGGIHFRHDNEAGFVVGVAIGGKAALGMRAEAARSEAAADDLVAAAN